MSHRVYLWVVVALVIVGVVVYLHTSPGPRSTDSQASTDKVRRNGGPPPMSSPVPDQRSVPDADWTQVGRNLTLDTTPVNAYQETQVGGRALIRAVHWTQHYTEPGSSVAHAFSVAAPDADLFSVTDVNESKRAKGLDRSGWTVARESGPDNIGEVGIASRNAVWTLLRTDSVKLAPDIEKVGGSTVAVLALYRHNATGKTLLYSVSHLPRGVEGSWKQGGLRVRTWQQAIQAWRRHVADWRHRYHPDGELMVADFNLSIRLPWVRAYLEKAWPGITTPAVLPTGGTFGSRLIDYPLSRRIRGLRFRILPKTSDSDHSGIAITGTV